MTDILCKWLNEEVRLSQRVDPTDFSKKFSTGFLLGEVLNHYQLQNDFDQFSLSRTADSKLNNFTRVEPILHLLEVPFDTNVARDIMTEKQGVATRLMYQLFIALNKKEKNNLTGVAMETMRPAAPVKLENVESLIYKERLKHMTPRQTDLNLEALAQRYHKKQVEMESIAFKERFEEEERYLQKIQEQREALRNKYRDERARKTDMLAKIHAATVHIPKPPPKKSSTGDDKKVSRSQIEAHTVHKEIDEFEDRLKRMLPPSQSVGEDDLGEVAQPGATTLKTGDNNDYINKIRKRLNEDSSARAEREKRRRKVLVDQLKAHELQEDARHEEMLVNRLMRQSQQERRIAVQLLQARHEKDVLRKNRHTREKQYEELRAKEFEAAMNREAEIARLAKQEYLEQTEKDRELHNEIMAQRSQERYAKHYDMCGEVLSDIVDMSTKVGEYRELTNKLLPEKLMREWKTLFTEGKPLYEVQPDVKDDEGATPTPEQILEEERKMLLDEGDFTEYRSMMGAWQPPEESEIQAAPSDNPIVGHIVQRLFDMVHPPTPPPPAPEFPPFPIKACVLGKVFAGKTTVCKQLAESHRMQVLDVENLVAEAVNAHKNGEVLEQEEEPEIEVEQTEGQTEQADTQSVRPSPAGDAPNQEDTGTPKPSGESPAPKSTEPTEPIPDNKSVESKSVVDDGMEKGDPEKPVDDTTDPAAASPPASALRKSYTSSKASKLTVDGPQPTNRARLGQKAISCLKKGKAVDDQLMVDILVEAIRTVPEGSGWMLDGFPNTYTQAKLLEKALTGMDPVMSRENTKISGKESREGKGKKKSALAPDPKPAPPPPEPISGIDVVVLFDIPNDVALRRSAGRTYALQADEQYQEEFKPPPEGSMTGLGNQEKVVPIVDPSHDEEQIQHRLTAFDDTWPKLEKWFTRFGTLRKVDVLQEQETVFLEVENILEETLNKLQGPPPEETLVVETEEVIPPEPEKAPEPVTEPKPEEKPEERKSRSSSKKSSRAGSGKRSGSRGSVEKKEKRSGSKTDSAAAKKSGKGSRGSSPKSPKRSKSGSKKSKTPEPEPEPEPEVPPGTPPPLPGSDLWEYVDQPVDDEVAHILCSHWEKNEAAYIKDSKQVFRKIRDEREDIIRYLYEIRQAYVAYLRRPDHKQEFVSQWQKDFNEVADDLRDDDETRGELHQRVDDLRERLWSICDERKENAESERESIMNAGWVDDHLGVLTNQYITLLQTEVDRFQDTWRLLKDYYKAMEGKIPDELQSDYVRIPLVELPVEEVPPPEDGDVSKPVEVTTPEPSQDDSKPTSKAGTPSGKKKKGDDKPPEDDEPAENKKRIPVVPRRPVSPDPAGAGAKGKQDKAKAKPGKDVDDGPSPPSDPDEKLVFDAFMFGIQAIDKIIAAEQAAREAEEEAERQREAEREAEKLKAAAETKKKGGKGGKGGKKSRSPSPKKGRGKDTPTQPTPPPDTGEESEEEKLKKQMKERAKQEYFSAITNEASAAKVRMQLVRMISGETMKYLRENADNSYKDMHDWLGARFLKEMQSIDQMSEVMRFAVENGTKIRQELKIDQEDFLVNEDLKVLRSPSLPAPSPPVETVEETTFTVQQIMNMYEQLALTAPSGIISLKNFQEILIDLVSLTHGTEEIPEVWLNFTPEKVEALTTSLSVDGEYIDWRAFLLQISVPWPIPSQSDLLCTLERFKEMDQTNAGYVTREQYCRIDLWFKGPPDPSTPTEDFPQFDRLTSLKDAFFDLFADHSEEPYKLDYVSMLLYFSLAKDPFEGFLRALSVATGTHMPRLPGKKAMKGSSRPTSRGSMLDDMEAAEVAEDDHKVPEDIPDDATKAIVNLEALDRVLHHGQMMRGESHQFSTSSDPEDAFSRERLAGVFQELGGEDSDGIPFSVLIEHPVIQDIIALCRTYRVLDLQEFLAQQSTEHLETQSIKAGD